MGNVLPLPSMCKEARVVLATATGTKKRRNRPVATTTVNDTPDQDGGAAVKKNAPWRSGCRGQELDVGEECGVRLKVVMTRKDAAEFMAGLEERAAAERKAMVGKLDGAGNGVMSPCPDAWRPRLATIPENYAVTSFPFPPLPPPPSPSSATGGDDNGAGTPRPARQALRAGHDPGLQEVQVEPVREHVATPDRGGEHQGGRVLVRRQAHRLRLQGQDQEQRQHHPMHLGQGHAPPRKLRRRARAVPLQPPGHLHGQEGPRSDVPQHHLRVPCLLHLVVASFEEVDTASLTPG